jgi:hypothetical protein
MMRLSNALNHRNFRTWVGVAGLFALGAMGESAASNLDVVHWINDSAQNVVTELNAGRSFVTNFKGINDVTVTQSFGSVRSLYTDTFTASPGNNPNYLTSFVGNTAKGTGNGSIGALTLLESSFSENTLQFDFNIPLTYGDRIILADIDFGELIQIQAFTFNGSNYVPVSLSLWPEQNFTGMTGVLPDSSWASWNSSNGQFTAGTSSGLTEPLNILTPDQSISRVIFSKLNTTAAASTEIQFVANVPEPSTLLLGGIGGLAWAFGRRSHFSSKPR